MKMLKKGMCFLVNSEIKYSIHGMWYQIIPVSEIECNLGIKFRWSRFLMCLSLWLRKKRKEKKRKRKEKKRKERKEKKKEKKRKEKKRKRNKKRKEYSWPRKHTISILNFTTGSTLLLIYNIEGKIKGLSWLLTNDHNLGETPPVHMSRSCHLSIVSEPMNIWQMPSLLTNQIGEMLHSVLPGEWLRS